MRFVDTGLAGAHVLEVDRLEDDRGFFARTHCQREFEELGLHMPVVQCNVSFNRRAGTLRGMHLQIAPRAEVKLVRCTRGAVFDVIVDLRPDSPTRFRWFGTELTAENHRALYIPEGFAHGFQTLEDDCEVFYQMSEFYSPEHARGVSFDDAELGIEWPREVTVVSDRDRRHPTASQLTAGDSVI